MTGACPGQARASKAEDWESVLSRKDREVRGAGTEGFHALELEEAQAAHGKAVVARPSFRVVPETKGNERDDG
jgi:hypothetical protein